MIPTYPIPWHGEAMTATESAFDAFEAEWVRLAAPLPAEATPGAKWCVTLSQANPDFTSGDLEIEAVAECSRGPVLSQDFDAFAVPGYRAEARVTVTRARLLTMGDVRGEGRRLARDLARALVAECAAL